MSTQIEKEIKNVMEQYESDSSEILPDWIGALAGGFVGVVITGLLLTTESVTKAINTYGIYTSFFIFMFLIIFLGSIGFVIFSTMKQYKKNAAYNNALENLYLIQKIIAGQPGLYSKELSLLKTAIATLLSKREEKK